MFTRDVKQHLTKLWQKGARPPEHVLEVLRKLGYVDERGHITAAGNAKARELLARVESNRQSGG